MATEKKYEIDYNDFIKDEIFGNILGYRIIALKDFSDVKKGDKGGYVLKEENLSQYGDCWLYDKSVATDDSIVTHSAKLYDNTIVQDHGRVLGCAKAYSASKIYENGIVTDYAELYDNSFVSGYAIIYGHSKMKGISYVSDFARICGKAVIENQAIIGGNAYIEDAIIGDGVWINADVYICGNVKVLYDIGQDGRITNYDENKQLIIDGLFSRKYGYRSKILEISGTGRFTSDLAIYIDSCEAFGYDGCDFINESTIWVDNNGNIIIRGSSIEDFMKENIEDKDNDITPEYAENMIKLFNTLTNYFDKECDYINKSWRGYIDAFRKVYIG